MQTVHALLRSMFARYLQTICEFSDQYPVFPLISISALLSSVSKSVLPMEKCKTPAVFFTSCSKISSKTQEFCQEAR